MDNRSTRLSLYFSFIFIFLFGTSKAGIPLWGATTITLKKETLFENRSTGTLAGTLGIETSQMLNTYTFTLVPGGGDCSNDLFEVVGNKVLTLKPLDYEERKVYCIRVRATAPNGTKTEKSFSIDLTDVNEAPTLAAIDNQEVCFTGEPQYVQMKDVSAGPEKKQKVTFFVSSDNLSLFNDLSINQSGRLAFQVKADAEGSALVTVTVKDNGGIDNEGTDSFNQTFRVTVNAAPVVAIASNKGTSISKGETVELTASGGESYRWISPQGAISGTQTSRLVARPSQNTTYRVRVTSAAGCVTEKEISIEVKDDYLTLVPTNVLTPNGDGKNDRLVVKNIDLYPDNEIRIFDKAGRMLFSKKNYRDEWDGTFQGSILAEGPYFYVIDFGQNRPKFKSHVTIIRD